MQNRRDGVLVLADGSVFEGELFGAPAVGGRARSCSTRCCPATRRCITDPSYAGQIIAFTNPHIGNYGVNATDFEAVAPHCRGVVVRELARRPSNHRAEAGPGGVAAPLRRAGHRRHRHPPPDPADPRHRRPAGAFGTADDVDAVRRAGAGRAGHRRHRPRRQGHHARAVHASASGDRCASSPTTSASSARSCATSPASAPSRSCRPRRRPPRCSPAEPDGVFLSNGPGDPARCRTPSTAIGELLGEVPVFGICLGHQLLGRALGGRPSSCRSATTAATTRCRT